MFKGKSSIIRQVHFNKVKNVNVDTGPKLAVNGFHWFYFIITPKGVVGTQFKIWKNKCESKKTVKPAGQLISNSGQIYTNEQNRQMFNNY